MVTSVRELADSANQARRWRTGLLLTASLGAIFTIAGCGTGIYQNFADNVNCELYGNCGGDCDDCDDWDDDYCYDCDDWCWDCGGWGGDWYGFDFGFGYYDDWYGPGDWGGYPPDWYF